MKHMSKALYTAATLLSVALMTSGCASTAEPAAQAAATPAAGNTAPATTAAQSAPAISEPQASAPAPASEPVSAVLPVPTTSSNPAAKSEPASADDAFHVVQSCGKESFVSEEKAARDGIAKGWKDTQAGRFGYGFRDATEHKKWMDAQKALYAAVAESCQSLTTCTEKAGKQAKQQCADEARLFSAWQKASQQFVAKVKTMESTMAPNLCSITPNANDLSDCFTGLAARIDDSCKDESCKDLSKCWRGVAYLDEAIRQAESSCGFVHTELSQCRSYIEATGRREAKFKQCQSESNSVNLQVIPVL